MDEYYDQFLGQFVDQKDAQFADAVDLCIELNAVVFDDGTIAGPDDDSMLADLFSTYVNAKQEWYRGIIRALDEGQSVAESFRPVETFAADVANHVVGASHDLWNQQAAGEASSWRQRYADADPAVLKQAIRLEPFSIRRD